MQITRLELRLAGFKNTIAQGTVEFNECLVVQVKLIKGDKGAFVKLGEARQGTDGKWYDSAYVKDEELRKKLTEEVIAKYNEVLTSSQISA